MSQTSGSHGSPPAISVILIAFNDESRVARAVASVLQQSFRDLELIVVDDASTDHTVEAARAAAEGDPRARLVKRTRNSGGCGAPRNDGVRATTGRYLCFIDSDDELLPGALAHLFALAAKHNADVATGAIVRRAPGSSVNVPLRPQFYENEGTFSGLEDRDDLFYDTLVPGKLISREFVRGIVFPEDIHYEDQLFTAELWLRKPLLVVSAQPVYLWYIHSSPGNLSITSRRGDIGNALDRFEVNRRIDRLITDPRHRRAKFAKFARHDLQLYARDLPLRDSAYATAFLEATRTYLAELPTDVLKSVPQPYRLAIRDLLDANTKSYARSALLAFRKGHLVRSLRKRGSDWYWPFSPRSTTDPDFRLTKYVERRDRSTRLPATFWVQSVSTSASGHVTVRGHVVPLTRQHKIEGPFRVIARVRGSNDDENIGKVALHRRRFRGTLDFSGATARLGSSLDVLVSTPSGESRAPLTASVRLQKHGIGPGLALTANGNLCWRSADPQDDDN